MEQPDSDPVRTLIAAERDGLLAYRGYSSGDRYEVEIAGEARTLPLAEVGPTVERLRLVQRLADEGHPVAIVTTRDDMSRYVMKVEGEVKEIPSGELLPWLGGYEAGLLRAGADHAGVDQLAVIRDLLTKPGRDDQCRLVILGLMHGQEETTSTGQLAEKTGRTKKAIVDALKFGTVLTTDMAERMIAAFGRPWEVTAGGYEVPAGYTGWKPDPPRMPGIARLLLIVDAADAGRVRYVDEPDPNKARWLRSYQLSVGVHTYAVPAEGLASWLSGLSAGAQQVTGGQR